MSNDINKKLVGQRIKSIRQEKGMTLEEFGKLFGAGKGLVSRWENGLSIPNPERLKSIAKIGDMSVSQLINGEVGESHYNWEAIKRALQASYNGLQIDNTTLNKTRYIVDKAFFLNLGIEDIFNIYLFLSHPSSTLETLDDLQEYFEQTADGLDSYTETVSGDTLIDLEMQISFLRSYAYKIEKYQKTGEWASDILSELEKNKD